MTHWVNKMNWYATREMQDYIEYINNTNDGNISSSNDKGISTQRQKKFGIYYRFPMFIRRWVPLTRASSSTIILWVLVLKNIWALTILFT